MLSAGNFKVDGCAVNVGNFALVEARADLAGYGNDH
jgi:hypothetical protein